MEAPMIENNPSNVSSGFEILLEEVETAIAFFTRIGARAFESQEPRRRNSAQWAHNTMRQEGLLKDDSPHGIWEITNAGKDHLKKGK